MEMEIGQNRGGPADSESFQKLPVHNRERCLRGNLGTSMGRRTFRHWNFTSGLTWRSCRARPAASASVGLALLLCRGMRP